MYHVTPPVCHPCTRSTTSKAITPIMQFLQLISWPPTKRVRPFPGFHPLWYKRNGLMAQPSDSMKATHHHHAFDKIINTVCPLKCVGCNKVEELNPQQCNHCTLEHVSWSNNSSFRWSWSNASLFQRLRAVVAFLWVIIERTSYLSVTQISLCWKALNMV